MSLLPDIALRDNTNQRLPCILVLDGSYSMAETMAGGTPIAELNAGLRLLAEDLKNDETASLRVQLLVLRFGGRNEVEVVTDWTDAIDFVPPTISASGNTPMGAGMLTALNMLEQQKALYRSHAIPYNRPWIFLMTDGEPNDPGWRQIADQCRDAENAGKAAIFPIGIGDANMANLELFSKRPPLRMKGLAFRELFVWMSASVRSGSRTALGGATQLPAPNGWAEV